MIEHEQNLRDLFAGLALIGLVHRAVTLDKVACERITGSAYHFADAMLRARDNTEQEPESIGGTDD